MKLCLTVGRKSSKRAPNEEKLLGTQQDFTGDVLKIHEKIQGKRGTRREDF